MSAQTNSFNIFEKKKNQNSIFLCLSLFQKLCNILNFQIKISICFFNQIRLILSQIIYVAFFQYPHTVELLSSLLLLLFLLQLSTACFDEAIVIIKSTTVVTDFILPLQNIKEKKIGS